MIDYRENNKWTVYIHTSPSDKYYVGITSKKPNQRWKNGNGYKDSVFGCAIKKYGWENIEHEIIATNLTKEEAENMEYSLIKLLQSNNKNFGYNKTDGGNAFNGMNFGLNPNAMKIICLNTLEVFDSISMANIWSGLVRSSSLISNFCNGTSNSPSIGKHPITGERLIWEYYIEDKKYVCSKPREKYNPKRKAVVCLTTMEVFNTITEACAKYGFDRARFNKRINLVGEYGLLESGEKMKWMFLKDYEERNGDINGI